MAVEALAFRLLRLHLPVHRLQEPGILKRFGVQRVQPLLRDRLVAHPAFAADLAHRQPTLSPGGRPPGGRSGGSGRRGRGDERQQACQSWNQHGAADNKSADRSPHLDHPTSPHLTSRSRTAGSP